ncbi:helix-turn-helix domain-containing protein, partial [Salmonella enterica subsp. enterica serovar Oranienburg]|nr:helix-turn-helix domain-containing protein [Salmonella enterica subsp. enterica serovar Oranienburg]EHO4928198.1 helix-turn-helix domain-containing protein [Salmonella enterica subsp. enterica serovar Corvallis]
MQVQTKNKLFGITNQAEIARQLGTSQQNVSLWVTSGKFPPRRILPFCRAVGFAVTPHQLDPILYPNPGDALPVPHEHIIPSVKPQ